MQTFVEIGSAVRKIFPDKKKQIENISRVAQLTLGARLITDLYSAFRSEDTEALDAAQED